MDKTDRLRDYGLAFLLYEQGLGVCGYELIRELFIFVKLILNSYLKNRFFLFALLSICATILTCANSMIKIVPIFFILIIMFQYYIGYKRRFSVSKFPKRVFTLYCCYCLFLVLKAVLFDSNAGLKGDFITSFFGNLEFGVLSFSIPCCALVVYERNWIATSMKVCDMIAVFGVLVGIAYIGGANIRYFTFLLYFLPFICFRLIIRYEHKILYWVYFFFSLYYCAMEDERSILVLDLVVLIALHTMLLYSHKLITKSIKLYCIIVPLVGAFLTFYNLFNKESFFEYMYTMYSGETTMVNDTRTFLFQELSEDLSETSTWLYGKGMFGTYYSNVMYVASKNGEIADNSNRLGTECGYLWLILKGGIIYFVLYFTLFYTTVVVAIRRNQQIFLFIAFLISSRLLFMFVSFTPAFDIANIFLWAMLGLTMAREELITNKSN